MTSSPLPKQRSLEDAPAHALPESVGVVIARMIRLCLAVAMVGALAVVSIQLHDDIDNAVPLADTAPCLLALFKVAVIGGIFAAGCVLARTLD